MSQDLASISYEVTQTGLVTIMFTKPGMYFITGYRIGGQNLHPTVENGPTLFQVSQGVCPQVTIGGLENSYYPGKSISLTLKCLDEQGQTLSHQPDAS